jgi:hypothetical protein
MRAGKTGHFKNWNYPNIYIYIDIYHHVNWHEIRFLQIEINKTGKEDKESAHMACVSNPIS